MAELELIADFLNTADVDRGVDELVTGAGLRTWLAARLSDPGEVDDTDAARARSLREALRGLALANNGGEVFPVDVATLNRAAAETGLRPHFGAGRARLEPSASGVDRELGRLVAEVYGAMATGAWERF